MFSLVRQKLALPASLQILVPGMGFAHGCGSVSGLLNLSVIDI